MVTDAVSPQYGAIDRFRSVAFAQEFDASHTNEYLGKGASLMYVDGVQDPDLRPGPRRW